MPEEKNRGSGEPGERGNCLKEDDLKTLADAKIPVLHLCADVSATENTVPVEKQYRLENSQPIVDFIMKHLS